MNQGTSSSCTKMLTTPEGIKILVEPQRRRRIFVCFGLSLICLVSISLLSQLWVYFITYPTYRINPNEVPYHRHFNKSLRFDRKSIFDHTFTLAEPLTCFNGSRQPKPVFLLVCIASSSGNYERRQAIRETWGSPKEIMGKNITTVFLLGETESGTPKLQDLQQESATHHDILQADFLDTYKNLTIKTIVGMKWIHMYCSHASYFMKTDDDMYISYANIVKNLSAPSTPSTDFVMGHLFPMSEVIRSRYSKFYMPENMFPDKFYPPYVAGAGYVMSVDLASKIYRVAPNVKFVIFEDVFVGLCLKTLHVVPIGHSGFTIFHINYEFCEYRNHRLSSHEVQPKEMHNIWKDLKENTKQC